MKSSKDAARRTGSRASHWLRNCSISASSAASVTSSFTSGMGSPGLPGVGGVGLVTVDFAAGGAGHDSDGVAVDDQPEAVGLGDDGDDLPGVGHADLDLLAGDLDAAAGGDPPLHRDGGFRKGCGPGEAGALEA